MMVPILQLAGAGVRLEDLDPGAEFKSKVEGCTVENRYVAGRYREPTQAGHERLEPLVRKCPDLIAQRAEAGNVGRSSSGDVGCGPDIHLILGHQNDV